MKRIILMLILAGITRAALVTDLIGSGDMDKLINMTSRNFDPSSSYNYVFGSRSRDITDGSDFQAVRDAFSTWIDEPSSALSAAEVSGYSYRPNRYNGLNEVSWINPSSDGSDVWSDILGLNHTSLATVVTWYRASTGRVLERDLYFNNVDYHWRTDTDGRQVGGFYVESVALHEIGHIFGLKDLYNPGQFGWEKWMGSGNEDYTMYGYTSWTDEDVILGTIDIAAMALLHPSSSVPEPDSISLMTLAAGVFLVVRRR